MIKNANRVKRARPALSARLSEGLTEIRDALRSSQPLEKVLTVNELEVRDPRPYPARAIRDTRRRLRVSQRLFADMLGVSVKQIEHLEQGRRVAQPTLCRLLEAINHDPAIFLSHTRAA